jgi:hypothetical protein
MSSLEQIKKNNAEAVAAGRRTDKQARENAEASGKPYEDLPAEDISVKDKNRHVRPSR